MITHELDYCTVIRDKRTKSPGFFKDPALQDKVVTNPLCTPSPDRGGRYSARIFPNGEFGVGYRKPSSISASDRRYEDDRRYAEENTQILPDVVVDPSYPEGFIYTRVEVPGVPPPKLVLGSQSSQRKKRYGLGGITAYGRKMLRNAGTLIDKACQGQYNRRVAMGTLTIPSFSDESMRNICINWHNIVRRFFQECKRAYARKRYRFDYASCTEVQPRRWSERGEIGLHLHFLFVTIRLGKGKWVLSHDWVRSVWQRILQDYLQGEEQCPPPQYNCQFSHTSSAAYIAKYASKGSNEINEIIEQEGEDWCPKQWWSISSGLRRSVNTCVLKYTGANADMLMHICTEGIEEYLQYTRRITMQIYKNDHSEEHSCPEEFLLGFGGMLTVSGKLLFPIAERIRTAIKLFLSRTQPFKYRPRKKGAKK